MQDLKSDDFDGDKVWEGDAELLKGGPSGEGRFIDTHSADGED